MLKIIQIFVLMGLAGCSTTPVKFSSNPSENIRWGMYTTKILYKKSNISIVARLRSSKSTIINGYSENQETWILSLINLSKYTKCHNINIQTNEFKVEMLKSKINSLPNSLLNIAALIQKPVQSSDILGFKYYGISNALISIREC